MTRSRTIRFGVIVVAGIAVAYLLQDSYLAYLGQLLAVFGILGLSLNLLFGYAGQISLGHAVFFAIGAYGSAILQTRFEWPALMAFPTAVLVSVLVAYVVGLPILRLTGHFLALATLALGLIVQHVLIAEQGWTGGHNGILVSNQDTIGAFLTEWLAYVAILLLVAVLVALERLGKAMPGKAMRMLQSDETVAASLGINVTRYKANAFAASAGLAALAGILFLHVMRIITPGTFGLHTSINILLIVVIGGVGSNWGTLVGAALFVLLPETLRGFADYSAFLYGVLVLAVLLFAPGGLSGVARSARGRVKRWSSGRQAQPPDSSAEPEAEEVRDVRG